jgi:hypothetical protein
MGSKPKKVAPPPVPAPQAIPETAQETGEDEMKKALKRSGYSKTILAGSLTPKSTGKKTVLG